MVGKGCPACRKKLKECWYAGDDATGALHVLRVVAGIITTSASTISQ